jgi:hypothetical protein
MQTTTALILDKTTSVIIILPVLLVFPAVSNY